MTLLNGDVAAAASFAAARLTPPELPFVFGGEAIGVTGT